MGVLRVFRPGYVVRVVIGGSMLGLGLVVVVCFVGGSVCGVVVFVLTAFFRWDFGYGMGSGLVESMGIGDSVCSITERCWCR